MKGRKPVAGAQRRGGADDTCLAKVSSDVPTVSSDAVLVESMQAPPSISTSERRMELWNQIVGDGSAYREQDTALLSSFVVWMDTAEQIQYAMTNEQGGVLLMVDGKPSPYLRQLDLATKNILKIADQLGCTPLARARLGLTEAARNNMNITIAERVKRAVERVQ